MKMYTCMLYIILGILYNTYCAYKVRIMISYVPSCLILFIYYIQVYINNCIKIQVAGASF